MPTRKRRVGFIPSNNVLKIIDKISEQEHLSNSKVVNLLIEEAIELRGLFDKKVFSKKSEEKFYNYLIKEYRALKKILNEVDSESYKINKESSFENNNDDFLISNKSNEMHKRFIQFLQFKKIMNIFDNFQ
tara:strand:- start:141 stop:533 length:393 start_codon:yes stop_codon:yes gene_type:complete